MDDFEELYIKGSCQLGYGAYSFVKRVKHKKSGKIYAMKEIDLNTAHHKDLQNINRELMCHTKLDHPNIIGFFGYIKTPENKLYLLLEYAENGTLFHFVHKNFPISEKKIHSIFYQTLQAVEYCHNRTILHRDLKPENILFDNKDNVKLCDFGWCVEYSEEERRQTLCGTSEYMAPEVLKSKKHDYKVDIWAMGILLYELFHKKSPFTGRSPKDI